MIKRMITGVWIITVICVILYFSNISWVAETATAVLSLAAAYEVFRAADAIKQKGYFIAASLFIILISYVSLPYYTLLLSVIFPLVVLMFASIAVTIEDYSFHRPIEAFLISILISFLFQATPELTALEYGRVYSTFAMASSLITDIAAYLVGKRIGKHKLAPNISPGKTVEGSVAGIFCSSCILFLCSLILKRTTTILIFPMKLLIYAFLASIIGQCGDLSMSVVKRVAGVKDFGKLLPGHGGILDRFDSYLFTAPFTLIFCCTTGGFLR